jgi:hypothetical protein
MNRAAESPNLSGFRATPVLQEVEAAVTAAEGLAAEIATRFARGEPAYDLHVQLAERVAVINRRSAEAGRDLPESLRAGIARLMAGIQEATASGEAWLDRSIPARAADSRVRRAYGLPPRDT